MTAGTSRVLCPRCSCPIWPEPFVDWYAGAAPCLSCRSLHNHHLAFETDWKEPTGFMYLSHNPARDSWKGMRRSAERFERFGVYDDAAGHRVWKYQRFDRAKDRYIEFVFDVQTGGILADQDHALTAHRLN